MANKVARSIVATLCTCMVRELDRVASNRNHIDWVSELWCPSLPECEAFQRCVTAQIQAVYLVFAQEKNMASAGSFPVGACFGCEHPGLGDSQSPNIVQGPVN